MAVRREEREEVNNVQGQGNDIFRVDTGAEDVYSINVQRGLTRSIPKLDSAAIRGKVRQRQLHFHRSRRFDQSTGRIGSIRSIRFAKR